MNAASRILLVDDDEGLRATLAALLEDEGYDVVDVADGKDAVEAARNSEFDLVLTDIQMPGLDGWNALREIRALHPALPVVMMTGQATRDLVGDAVAGGAFTLAEKPIDPEGLLDLVGRAMSGPAILVVDDDKPTVETLVAALEQSGIRAQSASDGDTAIDLVERGGVDVCVLDLIMPDPDGVEVCRKIRERSLGIDVVGITASDDEQRIATFVSAGAMVCLRKNLGVEALLSAIGVARRGRASQAENARGEAT